MSWFGGYVLESSNKVPGNHEILTVTDAIAYFSRSKIKPTWGTFMDMYAQAVLVSNEGGDIRFRIDNIGPPTLTHGHILSNGDSLVLIGTQAINQFRAIKLGETNGTLQVTYFY